MATVACPAPARVKPSRFDLARTFLVEMGYDRTTAAAALADPSLVSPADAASVGRILDVARTVDVRGAAYQIEPLHSPDGAAYRLTSPRGDCYDIEDTCRGATCSCPDFIYKRAGLDSKGCKHVAGLVAAGLIANAHTAPVVVEAPAAVEPLTEEQEADRAIAEDRACFLPVTEEGKRTAREISARQVRLERIAAELEALRSAPLEPVAPADPNDVECDPSLWPSWCDEVWTVTQPAPEPEPTPAAFRPFEPSMAERLYVASNGVVNLFLCDPKPTRPSADERPIKVSPARRTNVGSEYRDEDQLRNHGCV